MRSTLLITLSLLGSGLVDAQSPTVPDAVASKPQSSQAPEPRSEHIRVEDSDVRIDEVRVGGQTLSISVQPKGSLPAYQVTPQTGERTWKVMGF